MPDTRATWCGLCHARCGLLMDFKNGRAVSVRGDPDHPSSAGRTCRRGRMMLEHLYNPDRLDVPLRRVGSRGSGRWERVSWPAALDEIAERLAGLRESDGAETLAFTRGTYRTYHWDAARFFNLFGSPNRTGANPVCHCPSVAVETAIAGAMPSPDLAHAACVVVWGSCRSTSSQVAQWPALKDARDRGARFITVDPRRTPEAEMSDVWLPVRPGTDAALMLGWLHVICREDLFDRAFVEGWTVGFEDLRTSVEEYTPSRVAEITCVPEADIVSAARLYARTRPSVITWGMGIDKIGPNAQASAHARAILRAVTGNLDVPGGELLGRAPEMARVVTNLEMECVDALSPEQRAKQIGSAHHPLMAFTGWDAMAAAVARLPSEYLQPTETAEIVTAPPRDVFAAMRTGRPYPVKALICQAANPLLTLADPRRTLASLQALELFVVMDYYMTPTAMLADFVLPAACTVERDDLAVGDTGCMAFPRALDPLAERRSDYEFWMELGRRLAQAERWPWDTAEDVCNYRLAPLGMTFAELARRRGVGWSAPAGRSRELGFGTPSGKVELRSSILERLGCDPLPRHAPVPSVSAEFPLVLITGSKFEPMYHSEQRQWPTARAQCPEPLLVIHPEKAAELGIGEGDWVLVTTRHGQIRQRASLSDRVPVYAVDAQHGWWFPERTDDPLRGVFESNANVLCGDTLEESAQATGSWMLSGLCCRVEKVTPSL